MYTRSLWRFLWWETSDREGEFRSVVVNTEMAAKGYNRFASFRTWHFLLPRSAILPMKTGETLFRLPSFCHEHFASVYSQRFHQIHDQRGGRTQRSKLLKIGARVFRTGQMRGTSKNALRCHKRLAGAERFQDQSIRSRKGGR